MAETKLMLKLGRYCATEFLKPDPVKRLVELSPHFLNWFSEDGRKSFTINPHPDSIAISSPEKMRGIFRLKNAPRHRLPWARSFDYITQIIKLNEIAYEMARSSSSLFLRGVGSGQLMLIKEEFIDRVESFTLGLHQFVRDSYSDAILIAHDALAEATGDQRLRKARSTKGAQPNTWFVSALVSAAFVSPYFMNTVRENDFFETLNEMSFSDEKLSRKIKDIAQNIAEIVKENEELEMKILCQDDNSGVDRRRGEIRKVLEDKQP